MFIVSTVNTQSCFQIDELRFAQWTKLYDGNVFLGNGDYLFVMLIGAL
jgi:hypothetical protein